MMQKPVVGTAAPVAETIDVQESTCYIKCYFGEGLFSEEEPPHTGGWSKEEEAYAQRISLEFKEGNLDLPDGTSLRQFLSKMLHCNPKRISKHYEGTNYSKGRKFYKRSAKKLSPMELQQRQNELIRLRENYKKKLLRLRMPHLSDDDEDEEDDNDDDDKNHPHKKQKGIPAGPRLLSDAVPPPTFAPSVSDGNFTNLRALGNYSLAPPPFVPSVSASALPANSSAPFSLNAPRNVSLPGASFHGVPGNSNRFRSTSFSHNLLPLSAATTQMMPGIGQPVHRLPSTSLVSNRSSTPGTSSLPLAQLARATAPTSTLDSRLRALHMIRQLDTETQARASLLRELQLRRVQREIGSTGTVGAPNYPWSSLPAVAGSPVPPPLSAAAPSLSNSNQVESLLLQQWSSQQETNRSTPPPSGRKRKAKK